LDQFGLGSARPADNLFTDRQRAAARCLPIPALTDLIVAFVMVTAGRVLPVYLWRHNIDLADGKYSFQND